MAISEQAQSERLTIAQIAQVAGVSVPTVSKVLNHHAQVAPATRQHVEEVVKRLGYVRNRAARALAGGKNGLVDLVIKQFDSEYFMEITRGAQESLSDAGFHTVLSTTADNEAQENAWFARVLDRSTDGAILVLPHGQGIYVERLRAARLPFVIIDERSELSSDIPAVAATNWSGGAAATRFLIALGHQRIAIVCGPAFASIKARIAGYRAALDEAGSVFDPDLVVEGQFSLEEGIRLTHHLMRLDRPPTAIFASSDLLAAGVYRALVQLGKTIPGDVSVIGFDDIPFANLLTPALTTVRQPLVEMGRVAASMLIRQISGKPLDISRVELATTLIQRDSCAPAPQHSS